jgi:CheY-like chemotaxis protein
MLSFSDTGVGMDAVTLSRIFEPFYTTKGRDKGTGLGLATVYGIVTQNDGFINVDSEIQQGSVFKIYFPSEERRVKKRKTKLADESDLKGNETILLVEDDDSVREVTTSALREYGYKVIPASNGEEAIRVYEEHKGKFDMLLTDVVMPLMSGRELAEKLSEKDSKLKILYFSGYTDDSIVRHGILSEGMQFIQKPYSHTELAKKIRSIIEK